LVEDKKIFKQMLAHPWTKGHVSHRLKRQQKFFSFSVSYLRIECESQQGFQERATAGKFYDEAKYYMIFKNSYSFSYHKL